MKGILAGMALALSAGLPDIAVRLFPSMRNGLSSFTPFQYVRDVPSTLFCRHATTIATCLTCPSAFALLK